MTRQFKKLSHSIYECKNHIVFCPKYRYKILQDEVAKYVTQQIYRLCDQKDGMEVIELNVQKDHVHLIVPIPPKYAVSKFMGYLKGKLAKKQIRKLCETEFACEQDARQAVAQLDKGLQWHTLEATYQPLKKYPRPGRPSKGMEKIIVGWRVQVVCQQKTALIDQKKQWFGRFILATNELDTDRLPDEKWLTCYKAQGKTVE